MTTIEIRADGIRYGGNSTWWIDSQAGDCTRTIQVVQMSPEIEPHDSWLAVPPHYGLPG